MSGFTRRGLMRLAAGAAMLPAGRAMAQQRSGNIRFLVGTAAGGSPDIVGRLLSEKLSDRLGKSIYVENMTQGAGAVAYRTLSRSEPDGNTMGILTSGYSPQVAMRPDPAYDPIEGFTFVSMLCGYPLLYAVPAASPIKSFPDLLDRARKNPGQLSYTITGYGSGYHVLTKWVELESGVSMRAIPYRGIAAGVPDVLSGRVDVLVDASTAAIPRIQSGQFRVLAVSSDRRFALLPDAPTVAETLPGVGYNSWLCLALPPGSPRAFAEKLNAEVKAILDTPAFEKQLLDIGSVPFPTSMEETRKIVASEIVRWGDIIKRGNIKAE